MKNIFSIISIFSCGLSSIFGIIIEVPNLTEKDILLLDSFAEPQGKRFYDTPMVGAFNTESPFCKTALILKEKYGLTTAIETGTFEGKTTLFFSKIFKNVHSFEINDTYINLNNEQFKNIENVHIHPENSGEKLKDLLKSIDKSERILFYLDAHWNSYWPLRDEISQITKYFKDNCILLIDDAKIPGYDITFDKYGKHECSLEYIKDSVDKLFSGYKVYHLITDRKFRGKLLLIPDSWEQRRLTLEDFNY